METPNDAIVRVIREAEEDLKSIKAPAIRLRTEAQAFREIQRIVRDAMQNAGG